MSILLDVVFLLVLVISVVQGYLKGLVHTVLDFISMAIAAVVANSLAVNFAPVFSQKVIKQGVINYLMENTSASIAKDSSSIIKGIAGMLDPTNASSAALNGIIDSMANPLALGISRIILFLVFFALIMALLRIVILIIDAVFKLPVLNIINRIGGVAFGVLQGYLIACVLCIILSFGITFYEGTDNSKLSINDVQDTILVKLIYYSPLSKPFLYAK